MRKLLILTSAMALCFSSLTFADTKTDDSTNTYTPSDQLNEKLHQKPVAEDANSGSDMSTTKEESAAIKNNKLHQKKKGKAATDAAAGSK
jgi:hypothetical protein